MDNSIPFVAVDCTSMTAGKQQGQSCKITTNGDVADCRSLLSRLYHYKSTNWQYRIVNNDYDQ
eukprot:14795-Heterococcus_DN1.PRE.3